MIVAWAGQKGGAGKSTLAIATAAELHRRDYAVLLVDADPQGTSTTWGDVAAERAETEDDADFPHVISMRRNLHEQLPDLAVNYDFTIIDCPGGIDELQRAALVVANLALIPVTPDTSDVWALSASLELIEQAQQFRPDLDAALVLNKMRATTAEAEKAREILEPANLPLFSAEIGYRVAYARFPSKGLGVVGYDSGKAAEETKELVDEIIKHRDNHHDG